MDPFSALGAAVTISTFAVRAKDIVGNIYRYYEAVRDAPKRARELRQEMGYLCDLLDILEQVTNEPNFKPSQPLFTAISSSIVGFKETLDDLDKRTAAANVKGIKRLKWPFSNDDNDKVLEKLQNYKTSFIMALQLKSKYICHCVLIDL